MEARPWHQHYDSGVPTSIEQPSGVLDELLATTAEKYPDNKAIIFGGLAPLLGEQHQAITYRELDRLVNRFAAGLQELGLQPGERVAIYLPNCPQYVIAYYGALRAGAVVVPCNPLYVARELEHQLNDSGATFILTLSMLYGNVKQIRANTLLKQVLVTNIKEYFPGPLKLLFTLFREKKDGHRVDISGDENTTWLQEFLAAAPPLPRRVEISADETALLMYTGGTTGVPKGAQLTHKNALANTIQTAHWLPAPTWVEGREIMLTVLPLSHCYSMTGCMNVSILSGYTQVIIPNARDLKHVLTAIDIHKPTIFPGVPTLYNAINHHPAVQAGRYDLKSIQGCISGAASLPREVQVEFERITQGRLVEGYGLSEASPVVIANPMVRGGRPGAIGVPLPDTDAKIVDAETEETDLGPGQPGVLCIHGPQVMKGYWGMPTETANTLRLHADGKLWLHTGDIAVMSEDGYFSIVDRKKDMILAAGGYNVYPRDIEERLYEHPKVMEVAAIGVPVGHTDQRCKAFVVLNEGQTATEEELIAWCREGLARYKVPKYVEFRVELPKTMVGKILRRQLMEEEEQKEAAADRG